MAKSSTDRNGIVLNIQNPQTSTVVIERKKNAGSYSEVTRLNGGGSWYYVDLLTLTNDTYTYRTYASSSAGTSSYSNEVSAEPTIISSEYDTEIIKTSNISTGVSAGTGIAFSSITALAGDSVGSVAVDQTYVHPSASYATVAQNVLGSITSASYALTASYASNGGGGGISNTGSFSGSFTGSIKARGVGTSTTAIRTYLQNSDSNYFEIRVDGSQWWGSGTPGAYDVHIARTTTSTLELTGKLTTTGGVTASEGFKGNGSQVTGVLTSSYALKAETLIGGIESASFATNAYTASYSKNFQVSGPLQVSGSSKLTGSFSVLTGSAHVQRRVIGNSATSFTVTWTNSNSQRVTLSADSTASFASPASGGVYVLEVLQNGTGGYKLKWPSTVLWATGSDGTITTTPNRKDVFTFYYTGLNYLGQVFGRDFADTA